MLNDGVGEIAHDRAVEEDRLSHEHPGDLLGREVVVHGGQGGKSIRRRGGDEGIRRLEIGDWRLGIGNSEVGGGDGDEIYVTAVGVEVAEGEGAVEVEAEALVAENGLDGRS